MTLPAQLRRGHAPGDILDGNGRLFASIHPGRGGALPGLAALAEEIVGRWNQHIPLVVQCARLERLAKDEAAARIRAEEALAKAKVALEAQTILKSIVRPRT